MSVDVVDMTPILHAVYAAAILGSLATLIMLIVTGNKARSRTYALVALLCLPLVAARCGTAGMPVRPMTSWEHLYPSGTLWIGRVPDEPGTSGLWDQLGWTKDQGRRKPVYIRRRR
jgi:hypothetical protein